MANLKDSALNYEAPTIHNIAELEKVSTELDVKNETHSKSDGETFTVDVVVIDGQKYRVPATVLANLKAILQAKPDLKFFKVNKSGAGMQTNYTVIPMD